MACGIALVCAGLCVLMNAPWGVFGPIRKLDDLFYDSAFSLRKVEPKLDAEVVIIAVDDKSIEVMDQVAHFGWPWPREYWGHMVKYLQECGAKAVAFDLLFDRSSVYNNSSDDDEQFAAVVNLAAGKLPVVFATVARADGSAWGIAPKVNKPMLGAANITGDDIIRQYDPAPFGRPSFALATVNSSGAIAPEWTASPYLLHYYGPHGGAVSGSENRPATFKYVRAASVLAAAVNKKLASDVNVSPEMFKGKIVLIGTITAGTYDLKASPVSAKYPGIEVHATAIQNMLEGRRVIVMGGGWQIMVAMAACLAGAVLTVWPRVIGGTSLAAGTR